jgi:hypothetical protein
VDDIGADLVAAGRGQRYAVSVKARLFRPGSRESRVTVIETVHLRMLSVFADRFGMVPLLAQAVCLADDAAIHLFLFRARNLAGVLPAVKQASASGSAPATWRRWPGTPRWTTRARGRSWWPGAGSERRRSPGGANRCNSPGPHIRF